MREKEVIIIGAGIAGLSAGCYLQMNGYKTQIFELWKLPGGVCTAWDRKGYTFDGCIHWLVGSSEASNVHKIWEELHAVQNRKFINFEIYATVEYENGKVFSMYSDADKLGEEMKRIAPEDEEVINEFISAIKEFSKINMPVGKPHELFNIFNGLNFIFTQLPLIKLMGKWGKVRISDYAKKFKNRYLKEIIGNMLGVPDFPMAALLSMFSWMHNKVAGYPVGGSLEFARSIEKRYMELGGKINYSSRVVEIITENNRAAGIKLEDGKVFKADIVISAADGHDTIFRMLGSKYIDKEIQDNYNNLPLFPPTLQISLGISRSFEGQPHSFSFRLDKPILTSDKYELKELTVRIYSFDPTLAPKGKTPIILIVRTDYDYWDNLRRKDMNKYNDEKARIADEIIDALDKKYGNIRTNVEAVDVATPMTYVRYTNNWRGSWEGWFITVDTFGKKMKKTLPGLENFYMIGQWVEPGGGVPTAASSGRNVTQIICKKDRIKFKSFI